TADGVFEESLGEEAVRKEASEVGIKRDERGNDDGQRRSDDAQRAPQPLGERAVPRRGGEGMSAGERRHEVEREPPGAASEVDDGVSRLEPLHGEQSELDGADELVVS